MFNSRQLTFFTSAMYFFLIGVDYAIILPSLNLFLISMDAASYFVGYSLSALCFTALLSGPVYGAISDKTKKSKLVVIVANIIAVVGSILYFLATSAVMIVISRLIAGLAVGAGASVLGMVTRATTKEERTSILSKIFAGRQTGVIIGPAFNLLFVNLNFYIFSCPVNQYTAPGLFMTLLWILHTLLVFFCYKDLDRPTYVGTNATQNRTEFTGSDADVGFADLPENSSSGVLDVIYKDLLTEESVVLLFLTFTVMFLAFGVEAVTTPLSAQLFDWNATTNSIYYCVSGILYVISLFALNYISLKVVDRHLILFGITAVTLDNLLFLFFLIFAIPQPAGTGVTWMFSVFILYGVILAIAESFAIIPVMSLFSKFTSEENQGFNQGIRITCLRIGQILGPFWASSLLNNYPLMAGVNLGLMLLSVILFLISYKRIALKEERVRALKSIQDLEDEQRMSDSECG